uniref:Nudix hydrolase domain-containing protein n=1 Tax=Candidatus Giovannonibacteria bacterium GW2011_GWF2_42_19 TaxID=1618659 RepID=A0A0G0ZAU6_9BACT|nr:MAG: hypothetical protein UV11_C0039G0001 [Candidatus Giovannonibacteria bacterium GW2011_GWF2_42_19]
MRDMQAGCSKGIYMPDPFRVALVWSIKFRIMAVPFLLFFIKRMNENPFRLSDEDLRELSRTRVWPLKLVEWVRRKREELGWEPVKPDGWDLPGGVFTKEDRIKARSDRAFDRVPSYGLEREIYEELRLKIVGYENGQRVEFFELFHVKYGKSRSGSGRFENFYFWIRRAGGVLKTVGTAGESEAPEYVPIFELNLSNLYYSQAQVFEILLQKLVGKYNMCEYEPSLAHISGLFKDSNGANKAPKAFSEKPRDVDRPSRANQGRLVRMPKDIRYEKD